MTTSQRDVVTDVLGDPFTAETIAQEPDYEGDVVCTLVHRPAEGVSRGAVLYTHGYCDYFFQRHLADFFAWLGLDFYAVELRRYARSWLAHQTPSYCHDLGEYYADLDAALSRVRERDGHEDVTLVAHSTGGLVMALWAHDRLQDGRQVAQRLVLNSPWLDMHGSLLVRTIGTSAVRGLGGRRPFATVPRNASDVYGQALHVSKRGEWDYDLDWKPLDSHPVRAGWLRAVLHGHRRVQRGIDVGAPCLVLASSRSRVVQEWQDEVFEADTVLDVDQIAARSPRLGTDVTIHRVPGAMHDVFCSRRQARGDAFAATRRWLTYAGLPA